jgi:hypothetical protein
MVGFFPYEHPRYAYAMVLERGPAGTLVGASAAASDFFYFLEASAAVSAITIVRFDLQAFLSTLI